MKTSRAVQFVRVKRTFGGVALAVCALLAGCASDNSMFGDGTGITASDRTRMTQSGFLSDYKQLKETPWGEGMQCWRAPAFDVRNYNKILISRILVSIVPAKDKDAEQTVDPSDLKTLTDYFHGSLNKALKPTITIVDQPGAGVVVMRIALTNLVPTRVSNSMAGTLIPFAFVAEAGSGVATGRPAGATPYLGETGMEMQFRDGLTGAILGECRDTEVGRKYAGEVSSGATGAAQTWAGGYLNSFQAWSYAKNAFDKWSLLVARRVTQLRAVHVASK